MKFKPKEVLVNLPVVLTFQNEDEVVQMAAAFNTFVHGKVKMKYEILGYLGGQAVGLFYIQRNNESQQLRDEFMKLILEEEGGDKQLPPMEEDDKPIPWNKDSHPRHEDLYAHGPCQECEEHEMLLHKGLEHCRCGEVMINGICKDLI